MDETIKPKANTVPNPEMKENNVVLQHHILTNPLVLKICYKGHCCQAHVIKNTKHFAC